MKIVNKPYWPDVAVVVVCLFAYAIVAIVDDIRVNKELDVANKKAESYRQVMIACLNRGGFHFPDTKRAYLCDAKEI